MSIGDFTIVKPGDLVTVPSSNDGEKVWRVSSVSSDGRRACLTGLNGEYGPCYLTVALKLNKE